jgi:hypothetical protein
LLVDAFVVVYLILGFKKSDITMVDFAIEKERSKGLASEQALTLLTTSVVCLYLDGLSKWLTRSRWISPRDEIGQEQLKIPR